MVDRLSHANVRAVLQAYLERNSISAFPWITKPANVEIGVAFELFAAKQCLCGHSRVAHMKQRRIHDKVEWVQCDRCMCTVYQDRIAHVGRLDILGQLREDPRVLCPVDHKTTGQINARFVQQYTMDSQLSGYLWDASQLTGKPAHEMVAFINAIELSVMPTSDRKCAAHGVPYAECGPEHVKFQIVGPIERTRRQIEEWRETAIELALRYRRLLHHTPASIHEVRTEGTFNGSCGYCEFREWCLADRPAKQVPHMFVQSRWDLWKHAGVKGKRPDPRVLYVDNSILRTMASCSTQALMRYGLGWTGAEQSGPLGAGIAAHAALEHWFKGGSADDALAVFDQAYTPDVVAS